jgi:hypothetical protein
MFKFKNIFVWFGIVCVSHLLGAQPQVDAANKKKIQPTASDNWQSKFDLNGKNPYDTYLMQKLIKSQFKSSKIVGADYQKAFKDSLQTYFFIAEDFAPTSSEFNALLRQVKKGNNLFIAFNSMNQAVYDHFFNNYYNDWYFANQLWVYDYDDGTRYDFNPVYQLDTIAIRWNLFKPDFFKDTNFYELSYAMGTPNYVALDYGKGTIFLHANPELFCNYQLLSSMGYNHANFALYFLPRNHEILWLAFADLKGSTSVSDESNSSDPNQKASTLLQYIFDHKSLLFAFLVGIFGILLYLIFRTKRAQPLVKYIPKTNNKSLAFADTMKAIYFQQSSPYDLLHMLRKNFMESISKHYFIDTSRTEMPVLKRILAEKSGLDLEQINSLFDRFDTKKVSAVDYSYLEETAKLQRYFYLKSGIIRSNVERKLRQKGIVFRRQLGVSVGILLLGIFAVLIGTYLLVSSSGVGILGWPLGAVFIGIAVRLLSLPVFEYTPDRWIFYPILGRKKHYEAHEIRSIQTDQLQTKFIFSENRTETIRIFMLSKYDQFAFSQVIARLENELKPSN